MTAERTPLLEKAFLLPVPLTKAQLGAWWTGALDEGLVNHGDCLNPVEVWRDPSQVRREPQPFNAWRPRGEQQPITVPGENDIPTEWPLALGNVLAFRQIEGLMLLLHTKADDEELTFLAFDARCFDDALEWKSEAARDRLLHLASRALVAKEPERDDVVVDLPAAERDAVIERSLALKERLRA